MAKTEKKSSSPVNGGIRYGADTSGLSPETAPEFIRRRAYQYYEMRGRGPGLELDDWLPAEREITPGIGVSQPT